MGGDIGRGPFLSGDNSMTRMLDKIDRLVEAVGKLGALALPLLAITILVNVMLRYAFNIGMIELEELQWHFNAIAVMTAIAWAYQTDDHVRVDAIYAGLSEKRRALVEICGVVFLLLPFAGLVAWNAWAIFSYSWQLREGSPMPSGLPARYIIKGVMLLGFVLLFLQGISIALRALLVLAGRAHVPSDHHYKGE